MANNFQHKDKKEIDIFNQYQNIRKGKNNDGVKTILNLGRNGDLFLKMYPQKGLTPDGRNPTFDHDKGVYSGITQAEAAQIVRLIEKAFMFGPDFKGKIELPHQAASIPKYINFELSALNGVSQMIVTIAVTNGPRYTAFLKEHEMEIYKEICRSSYSPIMRQVLIEATDDRKFKDFMSSK